MSTQDKHIISLHIQNSHWKIDPCRQIRFLFSSEWGPRKKLSIGHNTPNFSFLQILYIYIWVIFPICFQSTFSCIVGRDTILKPFVQLSCVNLLYFIGYFQQQKYSVFVFIPPDKRLGSVLQRIFVKMMTSIAWSFSTSQLLSIKLSSDITDNENPKWTSHSLPKAQLPLLKPSESSSLTNQRVHPEAFQMTVVIWH